MTFANRSIHTFSSSVIVFWLTFVYRVFYFCNLDAKSCHLQTFPQMSFGRHSSLELAMPIIYVRKSMWISLAQSTLVHLFLPTPIRLFIVCPLIDYNLCSTLLFITGFLVLLELLERFSHIAKVNSCHLLFDLSLPGSDVGLSSF